MKRFMRMPMLLCVLLLTACTAQTPVDQAGEWDCTVHCAAESTADAYVITYSDEKVWTQYGTLYFSNPNDFDITVHLYTAGEVERVADVPSGGTGMLDELKKDCDYTVGCHADVPENTQIRLTVHDGANAQP